MKSDQGKESDSLLFQCLLPWWSCPLTWASSSYQQGSALPHTTTSQTCLCSNMAFFTMAMANFLHTNFSLQALVKSHLCTSRICFEDVQEPIFLYTNSVKTRMLRKHISPTYQYSASIYAEVTLTEWVNLFPYLGMLLVCMGLPCVNEPYLLNRSHQIYQLWIKMTAAEYIDSSLN